MRVSVCVFECVLCVACVCACLSACVYVFMCMHLL